METDMTQVAALWRGEVPLAKTSWLYGVVGVLLLTAPVLILPILGFGPQLRELLIALSVVALPYTAFIAVAIWRAADNYQGRRAWSFVAKGSVLFVALQVAVGVATS